jgi:uncharacterized membrane protein
VSALANAFDWRTVLLAKHAQHVVLVHFPIALFIVGVAFDLAGQWTMRRGLAEAAYYNFLGAAVFALPVVATGLAAWQFQLEGQKLKGVLLLHLILGWASTLLIGVVWLLHWRARRRKSALPRYRAILECLGVAVVALAAHLGGFLSGVNGAG